MEKREDGVDVGDVEDEKSTGVNAGDQENDGNEQLLEQISRDEMALAASPRPRRTIAVSIYSRIKVINAYEMLYRVKEKFVVRCLCRTVTYAKTWDNWKTWSHVLD